MWLEPLTALPMASGDGPSVDASPSASLPLLQRTPRSLPMYSRELSSGPRLARAVSLKWAVFAQAWGYCGGSRTAQRAPQMGALPRSLGIESVSAVTSA